MKPKNCNCKYPTKILPTGSGHNKSCPAHQSWLDRKKKQELDDLNWDPLNFSGQAEELLNKIGKKQVEDPNLISEYDRGFLEGLFKSFHAYGAGNFISQKQWKWLKDIAAKYQINVKD